MGGSTEAVGDGEWGVRVARTEQRDIEVAHGPGGVCVGGCQWSGPEGVGTVCVAEAQVPWLWGSDGWPVHIGTVGREAVRSKPSL